MFVQANMGGGKKQKTSWSNRVNIMSNDTSANAYTTPSDGYIVAKTNSGSGHGIVRLSKDTTNPYFDAPQFSGVMLSYTCYVPKGLDIYVDSGYKAAFNECVFCPLVEY